MISEKQIFDTLMDIQRRIPKLLLKHVVSNKKKTPTLDRIVDLALDDPEFPEEKKKDLRLLKESGDLSQTIPTEDSKIAKMISDFVEREIKKEIKKGNLPPRNQIKNLPHIQKITSLINKPNEKGNNN